MSPLIEPHRRQLRDMLEEKMPPEGADAVLAALPASEADMPATKDFVRAEMTAGFARVDTNLKDLRVEMTEKFATADNKMNDKFATASTEMKRWVIGTGIAFAGVILAAVNTMPG